MGPQVGQTLVGPEGGADLQEGRGPCLEAVKGSGPGDPWSVAFLNSAVWSGRFSCAQGLKIGWLSWRGTPPRRSSQIQSTTTGGFSLLSLQHSWICGVAVGGPRLYWKAGLREVQVCAGA